MQFPLEYTHSSIPRKASLLQFFIKRICRELFNLRTISFFLADLDQQIINTIENLLIEWDVGENKGTLGMNATKAHDIASQFQSIFLKLINKESLIMLLFQ